MGTEIRYETVNVPVSSVVLSDRYTYRTVTVRPSSIGNDAVRTIECEGRHGHEGRFKFAATLGDIRAFGEALIRIADGT